VTLAALADGLAELDRLFGAALDAALPNPAALIFSELPLNYQGKRDLVFALGLLEEGENEAALIAGLMCERLRAEPSAEIAHLVREAWYYLRTSIDPGWQFDDGPHAMPVLLAYLATVLRARIARAAPPPAERAALLRRLREA
jgi:hypothetical protein